MKMEDLAASVQRGFEEMGEKISEVKTEMGEMGEKIAKMDAKIDRVEDEVTRLANSSDRRLELLEDSMRQVKTELHIG